MEHSSKHDPHPEALARLLLEHGDTPGALKICALWRKREPMNPRIDSLEIDIQRGQYPSKPLPLARQDAEHYVQKGYVAEALELYRRLGIGGELDAEGFARLELLEAFESFVKMPGASPAQLLAEEQVAARQLPLALLHYKQLARDNPTDEHIVSRADQLRAVVLGVPASVQAHSLDQGDLGQTTEMPLATKAVLMLREANLTVAAELFRALAGRDPSFRDVAKAAVRLSGLCKESIKAPANLEDGGTMRLGAESLAAFHVRMGNFAEAEELYRSQVEKRPANEELRQQLADLRVVLAALRPTETPAPGREKQSTGSGSFDTARRREPDPGRALGKRSASIELAAFRPPEPSDSLPASAYQTDDDPTKVIKKEELAEIHLKRGFLDKALAVYEDLLRLNPHSARIKDKVDSIRVRLLPPISTVDEPDDSETQVDKAPHRRRGALPPVSSDALVAALKPTSPEQLDPVATTWSETQRVKPVRVRKDRPSRAALDRPRSAARTILTPQPTVLPQDDAGRSVVEVPLDLPSVVERTPGRIDASEAAEIAEPLGVTVRPIVFIDS